MCVNYKAAEMWNWFGKKPRPQHAVRMASGMNANFLLVKTIHRWKSGNFLLLKQPMKMEKLSWKCKGTNHFLLVRILHSAYGTSNATFLCFSLVGLVEWIIFLIWWLAVKYREGQLHLHGIGRISYGWRQEGNSVSGSLITFKSF